MSNMSMILPFRKKGTAIHYLVKREFIPGWDQHPDLCGISTLVADETRELALVELLKIEIGITTDENELIRLGVCAVKRSSDHICYLYSVDLSKRVDSIEKDLGGYVWITDEKVMESIDPQLLSCYAKLRYLIF